MTSDEELLLSLWGIVQIVAEADNSDDSLCIHLCNVHWYGGDTDAEEMTMRHDEPCVVERARELHRQIAETAQRLAADMEWQRIQEMLEEQRWIKAKMREHGVYDEP